MNAFQYIVVLLLVALAALTFRGLLRGQMRKRIALFWLLVWGAGATAVLSPGTTLTAARWLGIGRGADLLLYCSVLAMLIGFFYVYTRFRRVDRQLTLLVRQLAVSNPRFPPQGGDNPA